MTTNTPQPAKGKRGRPLGWRKPTIERFIKNSVEAPTQPPPKQPKKPVSPKHRRGIWETLKTPEERSAHAKALRAKVAPENCRRAPEDQMGRPRGWTKDAYAAAVAQAEKEATALMRQLEKEGLIGEDAMAREALLRLLILIRSPTSDANRASFIKLLLEHVHAKPAAKVDASLRTAGEDWLLSIADDDGEGEA